MLLLSNCADMMKETGSAASGTGVVHGKRRGSNGMGWAKAYDEKYQREYYYNHHLGVSQWERPEGYHEASDGLNLNQVSCNSIALFLLIHCQESNRLSSRLSRSFQIVRETFEAAQNDEVVRERRKSGLALHLVSALRIPDSDDETDEDEFNDMPAATGLRYFLS
jgi:hypothetical protein